jgi:glycine/D-amino acid oxidase-like deaminating enzyme
MAPFSYWEQQSFLKGIDVAVIGSGIVGLNSAIHLKKACPHWKVAILERGFLPSGASTRNAGFACFGSLSELIDDLKTHTPDEVFGLVERRWRGLLELRKLLGDKAIAYQGLGGYEIFRHDETSLSEECLMRLDEFNYQLQNITGTPDTYSVQQRKLKKFGFGDISMMVLNKCEGQINTGAMMRSLLLLAKDLGVEVFNGIQVSKVEDTGGGAELKLTENECIAAKKVLLATNGFSKTLFPHLDLVPARNQVLVTEPLESLPFKGCFHYDRGYFYFRNLDGPEGSRILLGGGRHLAMQEEQTDNFGHTPLIQQALLRLLNETILPGREVKAEYWWSGIMGLGGTKKPIVEMLSPNIGVAVRLGGMGVALGNLVGKEAADMLKNNF